MFELYHIRDWAFNSDKWIEKKLDFFQGDKVKIDGQLYGVHDLPIGIDPE